MTEKIPPEAFQALEQETSGLAHGTVTLAIHVKDNRLIRYTTSRERSFVPGKPMTGSEEQCEASPHEGITVGFMDKEVPEDWESWKLYQRRAYWADGVQGGIKTVPRDRICASEVWCEALNALPKDLTRTIAREINAVIERQPGWRRSTNVLRYGPHGSQRGFIREGGVADLCEIRTAMRKEEEAE